MKQILADFIINLDTGRVRCRHCRRTCKSIRFEPFRVFMCCNIVCPNKTDIRSYPDGRWECFKMGALWGEKEIQDALVKKYTELINQALGKPSGG